MKYCELRQRVLVGAFAVMPAMQVQALTVSGPAPTLTFSCTELSYGAAPFFIFALDRDNTGAGNESYDSEVVDGNGNVLWSFSRTLPLGPAGMVFGGSAGTLTYGSTPGSVAVPTANPITYRLVSRPGNGLSAQTAFTVSGSCSTLPPAPSSVVSAVPTLGSWAMALLAAVVALMAIPMRRSGLGRRE